MLIVDGVPIDVHFWNYFHSKYPLLEKKPEPMGKAFKYLLENYYETYEDIPIDLFWKFLDDLCMVCSNIAERDLAFDPNTTKDEMLEEVGKIERAMVQWVLVEEFPEDEMWKRLDYTLRSGERRATSLLFHAGVYNRFHIIKEAIEKYSDDPQCMDHLLYYDAGNMNYEDKIEHFKDLIGEAYMGEYDEFIIGTIEYIQNHTMTKYHVAMANIVACSHGIQYNKTMKNDEAWRMLYPTYFDKVENDIKLFFERFTSECIFYFMTDFLKDNALQISETPGYNMFRRDGVDGYVRNILQLIDVEEIKSLIHKQ
jgi:hypothetical protein